MKSLSKKQQTDVTEDFNATSRYLDALLSIDSKHFDNMVQHVNFS